VAAGFEGGGEIAVPSPLIRHRGSGILVFLGAALLGGCSDLSGAGADPAATRFFAAPERPAGFDAERAEASLDQIADDPPAPPRDRTVPDVELPRQATRHIEEARRLFAEQRFSEAITELGKALRYHAEILDAHRLLALCYQLSGDDPKAGHHAARVLELKPGDLVGHFVLGRLADKTGNREEALRRYRTALKCEAAQGDAEYRALSHFHLGKRLFEERFYAAALAQFNAFDTELGTLGGAVNSNPELATIVRVQRVPLALQRADGYAMLGKYGAAADAMKVASTAAPEDGKLRAAHIRMLVLAKRLDEAAAAADRFVADSKASRESLELLVALHRETDHPDRTVTSLQAIVAQQEDNVDLRLFYIDALTAAKRYDEAANEIQDLLADHADLPEVRWKLVRLNGARGDWPGWLRALVEETARRPEGSSRLAEEIARCPEPIAKAIVDECLTPAGRPGKYLGTIAADASQSGVRDYLVARIAQRLNRSREAQALLERAARQEGGHLPAVVALAEMRLQSCRWDEARSILEAAGQSSAKPEGMIEALLGRCDDGLDKVNTAIEHYRKAIELAPNDIRPMMWLASLYERVDKVGEARKQYEQVLRIAPDSIAARDRLIRILWSAREQQQLADELAAMQRLAPNAPATVRSASMVKFLRPPLLDWGHYAKDLREILETSPDDVGTREDLARALIAMRDLDAAREETQQLLKRDPFSATGNELLAHVLTRSLEFELARAQFERMVQFYPNREGWLRTLVRFHMMDQDYDVAAAVAKRLLALVKPGDQQETAYRAILLEAYRKGGRFDIALKETEAWLAQAAGREDLIRHCRWFVLVADAGAKEHGRYLSRVRGWLAADPTNVELRGWLLGLGADRSQDVLGAPPGEAGLLGAKRYDEAVTQALAWFSKSNDDSVPVEWIVSVLQAAGRHDEAIEIASSQLVPGLPPQERVSRVSMLRDAYMRGRQDEQAVAATKDLLSELRKLFEVVDDRRKGAVDATLTEQRRMYSRILARAKRFDEAVDNLREMIAQLESLREKAAAVLPRIEDPAQRASIWYSEREVRRQEAVLLQTLAYVYQLQGQMDSAIDTLRDARQLMPEDVGLSNDLGYTLIEAGRDVDDAEKMVRFAVGESPEEAAYLDSLGWVFYRKGQFGLARTWLKRATGMETGEDPVVFDHLADACWRLGEKEEAVRCWRRSLEVYSNIAAEGFQDRDEKAMEKTKAKLAAAEKGGKPLVAEAIPDTQPSP